MVKLLDQFEKLWSECVEKFKLNRKNSDMRFLTVSFAHAVLGIAL